MMLTDDIWKILQPAAEIGDGATREDVEQGLKDGNFFLFAYGRSACLASSIKNTLRIGLGGGNLAEVQKIVEDIEKFAKDRHYNAIDILGRSGWEKALKGYEKKAVLLRKVVK